MKLIEYFYFLNQIAFSHPNTTITRVRQEAQKLMEGKDMHNNSMQHGGGTATGSAILDTYLQFITENTFGKYSKHFLNLFHLTHLMIIDLFFRNGNDSRTSSCCNSCRKNGTKNGNGTKLR